MKQRRRLALVTLVLVAVSTYAALHGHLNSSTLFGLVVETEVATRAPSRNFTTARKNMADVVQTALEVHGTTGLVLFTMLNNAFMDFAVSWLCNTAVMGHVHSHVMFVATDNQSASYLRDAWPAVHVVPVNSSHLSGDQVYSHVGYVRLMIERSHYIQGMLQAGVTVLLFEVDCVWLSNPLPLLLSDRYREADMVATVVQNRTAGGFLLLKPTPRTLQLWDRLMEQLDDLYEQTSTHSTGHLVSWRLNDQEFLSGLVKRRYGGIRVEHLPVPAFRDGQWYKLPLAQRQKRPLPVIINNNFLKLKGDKKKRAKKHGHWFLKAGNKTRECDVTAVAAVVTPG
ncbi:uncharacterized protein [Littorina saxatilis]|uniref:Nucleotide-diphospho-sugar transferase domain-containing protein n=1 Tax=Littorina saxatilis TaxID=31220 RepID=A0AAN9FV52_9CAEN